MSISEAKKYMGQQCSVTYMNRHGDAITKDLHVHDVQFVPMYGAYLIGDIEDVSLDKVTNIMSLAA